MTFDNLSLVARNFAPIAGNTILEMTSNLSSVACNFASGQHYLDDDIVMERNAAKRSVVEPDGD
jgi:hypothetical protein